jgi:hypothetical protein
LYLEDKIKYEYIREVIFYVSVACGGAYHAPPATRLESKRVKTIESI